MHCAHLGQDVVAFSQLAVASLTLERVPIKRSFVTGRWAEREPALPGRISLSLAISRMGSEVKMIFPLPQHAWGSVRCLHRPEAMTPCNA